MQSYKLTENMSPTNIITLACVLVCLMSVYSWLNFLKMETVESIRGLSTYDMPDADRKLGRNSEKSNLWFYRLYPFPVHTSGIESNYNP